jgi:hypothetical protein
MAYIENYGFTKTLIQDNSGKIQNEIEWKGNYDGSVANINVNINDNGNEKIVNMQLNNEELMKLLGIQPVKIPLEKRLMNDFLSKPITLEGALTKRKSRRHTKKQNKRRRKSRKLY